MELAIQSKHLGLQKSITVTAFNVRVARIPTLLN
jgi:hypothetical protein